MKRLLLCLFILLAPAVHGSDAAPELRAQQEARRVTAEWVEALSLTEDQLARVEAVLAEMFEANQQAVTGAAALGVPIDRQAIDTLSAEIMRAQDRAREQLAGFLDDEQLAGFDSAMRRQHARAAGEAIVTRLVEPLGLTAEQSDALVPIFAEDIETRSRKLEGLRTGGRSFGAARASRVMTQRMQEELDAKVEPILTPEQMTTYREIATKVREEVRGRERGRQGR